MLRLQRWLSVLRTVIGVPEAVVFTREEFVRHRLEARYSRPGSRCC
jgi:uncharacterized short protein YbdD (DUF466 family)